jgi:hypothetical protein
MTDLTKTFYIKSLLEHANIMYNLNIPIEKTLTDLMPKPPPPKPDPDKPKEPFESKAWKYWTQTVGGSFPGGESEILSGPYWDQKQSGGTPPGGTPLKTPSSQGDPANDPFAEFDDIFKDLTLTGPTPIPTAGDTTGSTSGPPQPAPSGLPDLVGGP